MCVCVSKTARRLRSFRFSQERRGDSEGFFVYRSRSLSPSLYLVILWKWMSKNDQNLRQNEISLSKLIQLYTDFYSYLTFSNVSSFPICKKAFCFVNRMTKTKMIEKLCYICNNMGHQIFLILESIYKNQWYHFH